MHQAKQATNIYMNQQPITYLTSWATVFTHLIFQHILSYTGSLIITIKLNLLFMDTILLFSI